MADKGIEANYSADMRYVGEGHEVPVIIPEGMKGDAAVNYMWNEFHSVHEKTFGFEYRDQQDVELVNLRVQAVGRANRPEVKKIEKKHAKTLPSQTRKVYWRGLGWDDCPIFKRSEVQIGVKVDGPAIFEEYGSTVVVPKNWFVTLDAYGNLKLEKVS